ncbi:hypothetical protein DSO57_1008934 [Entomophthora muscae]|uniref:Uncharacterized protein n=1 Tax=Entomophthora muscae TaxID=34485 RepID=A0ACC2T6W6_9FUNG|nr:hypothetical protein DSO57_1008934 [Entomophthora muscae]
MEMLPTTQEASPAEGRISAFAEVRAGKMASLRQASEKAFHQEEGQPRSKFLGASPEKKIQAALCTIQEAYLEKVSGLEQTIESLVKKCSSLESKNEDLEFFSNELQTRLSASQQNYQGLSVKYETLLNSQNQLVDKYNQLRRYALELDSFKKKIINLSGPNSVPIETNMIEQSILIQDNKLVPRTSGSAEKLQNAFRDCNISSPRSKENGAIFKSSAQQVTDRNYAQPSRAETECHHSEANRQHTTSMAEVYDSSHSIDNGKSRVIDVYERILADIEPEDYERFSDAIEDYNSNVISHHEALKIFREIIRNDHDFEDMKVILLETSGSDG